MSRQRLNNKDRNPLRVVVLVCLDATDHAQDPVFVVDQSAVRRVGVVEFDGAERFAIDANERDVRDGLTERRTRRGKWTGRMAEGRRKPLGTG